MTAVVANPGPDSLAELKFAITTATRCLVRRDRPAAFQFNRAEKRPRLELVSASSAVRTAESEDTVHLCLAPPLPPGESTAVRLEFRLDLRSRPSTGTRHLLILADWHPRMIDPSLGSFGMPARADWRIELAVPFPLVVAPLPQQTNVQRASADVRTYTVFTLRATDTPPLTLAAADWLVPLRGSGDVELDVYAPPELRDDWRELFPAAESALAELAGRWEEPPLKPVSIIDCRGFVETDTSLPGLILLGSPTVPFTRLREARLYRQLALQWFAVKVTPHPETGAWLALGPAVFEEMRLMARRHPRAGFLNLPVELSLLKPFSVEYFHRLMYYSAAVGRLLEPIDWPPRRFAENTVNLAEARFSRAGLFFTTLERRVGETAYYSIMNNWLVSGPAPTVDTLLELSQRVAGVDIADVVVPWLGTRGFCDYSVVGLACGRRQFRLRRLGSVKNPITAELHYDRATERIRWSGQGRDTTVTPAIGARLRRIELDPDRLLLEHERWNNHWPRQVRFSAIIDLPDFDAYQVFWGPYAWWDTYHGVRLGGWVNGRQFIDAGPLRGRHTWSLAQTYSVGLGKWQTGFSYQTPLTSSRELRLRALGKYAVLESDFLLGFEYGLSPVFRRAGTLLRLEYLWLDLTDIRGRDPRAWETARTAEIRMTAHRTRRTEWLVSRSYLAVSRGIPALGGTREWWKASLDLRQTLHLTRQSSLNLRAFAGASNGNLPRQSRFWLSGALLPTDDEPVNLGHQGWASPMQLWHFDGDANLRGWTGEFVSGHFAWNVGAELRPVRPIGFFWDVGNVTDSTRALPRFRMNCGVRAKLGPLYLDLTIWRWDWRRPAEFSPRLCLGLNLSGLGDF